MSYSIQYLLLAKDNISPILSKIKSNISALQNSIKNIDTKAFVDLDVSKAKASIESLQGEIKNLNQNVEVGIDKKETLGGAIEKPTEGLGHLHMGSMINRVAGYATIGATIFAAKEAVESFMDLETAQLGLRKALDVSGGALKAYTNKLRDLSENLGINQEEITRTATQFAKADASLNPEQLYKLTKLTYASAKAWETDAIQVQQTFESLKAIYGLDFSGLEQVSNVIDALGDKFGVLSESYLVEFMNYGAGVGKAFGLSKEQLLAFGTVAGESKVIATEAANALKHLGKEVLNPEPKALAAFQKLGLNWSQMKKLDAGGRIQSVLDAVNAYKGLDKANLVKNIIGGNYDDTLLRMAINSGKFAKALEMQADKANLSGRVMTALGMEAETARGRLNRMIETVRNLGSATGEYFVELLFGASISEVWSNIGNQIKSVWDLFAGEGGQNAILVLNIIKAALLTIGIAISAIVTGLSQLFSLVGGVVKAIWKLFQGDFSGAKDALVGGVDAALKRGGEFLTSTDKSLLAYNSTPLQSNAQVIKQQVGAGGNVNVAASNAANQQIGVNLNNPSASIQNDAAMKQLIAAQKMQDASSAMANATQNIGKSNQQDYNFVPSYNYNLGNQGR